ncbi:MAG: DUF2442 domain-containing protein [Spirochaetes bacterium]|nr:DUF2442 domain-containing protein [Spirochaetota bacterium]
MNSAVETGAIYLKSVKPLADCKLQATLTTGEAITLDLAELIHRRDIFWRLRQERYFRMVSVDAHGVLAWPEGEDLAPESVGRYVRLP